MVIRPDRLTTLRHAAASPSMPPCRKTAKPKAPGSAPRRPALHSGPGAAGGEPVSRPQPAAGLAARATAGRCWARRWWPPCARCRRSASPTRCTPTSCCRAIPARPIVYKVERVRDGGSFTTRRVTGHPARPGDVRHERLASTSTSLGSTTRTRCRRCRRPRICRASRQLKAKMLAQPAREHAQATGSGSGPSSCARWTCRAISRARSARPSRCVWMRASGRLPDAFPLHQCVLAYASDFYAAGHGADRPRQADVRQGHAAGEPRPRAVAPPSVPGRRMAALCPGQPIEPRRARVSAAAASSPATACSVASVAQEGLMRQRVVRVTCLDDEQKLIFAYCLGSCAGCAAEYRECYFPVHDLNA